MDEKREFFSKVPMRASNRMAVLHAEKERKEQRRIPLTEVSKATGVDSRTLGKWYRDAIEVYHSAVIAALCFYYDCRVSDLIVLESGSEDEHSPQLGQMAAVAVA